VSRDYPNSDSVQPLNGKDLKATTAPPLFVKPTFEVIDAVELAHRLGDIPASWVQKHSRSRAGDQIPSILFGRWRRYLWGSPALEAWISAHLETR
jgi:hypothetical protein